MTEAQKVERLTKIFVEAAGALDELERYNWGEKYSDPSETRPYYIFAQCSHLLYALYRIDERLLTESDEFCTFLRDLCELDFDQVQDLPYEDSGDLAGLFGAERLDAYRRIEKNRYKWFEFWFSGLELGAFARNRKLCETLLEWVNIAERADYDYALLKEKEKEIGELFRASDGKWSIQGTIYILNDIISAIICELSDHDSTKCSKSYMEILACQLGRIRRTIVWTAKAAGPYVLHAGRDWGVGLRPPKFRRNRAVGLLTCCITSEREEISCEFTEDTANRPKTVWVIPVNKLGDRNYEQGLFATWSYKDGIYIGEPRASQDNAYWIIETEQAVLLEYIARLTDRTIKNLSDTQEYQDLAVRVERVIRNSGPKWMPCYVQWTYIKELDALTSDLRNKCPSTIREAEQKTEPTKERLLESNRRPIKEQAGAVQNDEPVARVIEEPTNRRVGSKYTPEKIKNMLTSYEKHLREKNDVKYAWNCVAEEHSIPSGKAAEMAVRRHQIENK